MDLEINHGTECKWHGTKLAEGEKCTICLVEESQRDPEVIAMKEERRARLRYGGSEW
jgi:hypothetical protein